MAGVAAGEVIVIVRVFQPGQPVLITKVRKRRLGREGGKAVQVVIEVNQLSPDTAQ